MPGALLTPQQLSALVERIRLGNPAAEDELVQLFSERIAFLAFERTGDREAARDLSQDVMLAAVLALRDGRLRDAERLVPFVYGTARNLINNYLRTRGRTPREEPIGATLRATSAPDPVENSERAALIRLAVRALDPIDQKILLMTLVDALKPGEIASRLGLSSDIVRARKSRALKKTIKRVNKRSRR